MTNSLEKEVAGAYTLNHLAS